MRHRTIVILLVALCASTSLSAQIRQNDRQVLEAFYHATNGEDWRRSGGWLQPGTSVCDWYGVVCEERFELGYDIIRRVELPDNNLTGRLDARIFEIVHERLDLSGNDIGGPLPVLPASPAAVDLANNALTGQLPTEVSTPAGDLSGTARPSSNWHLDLSGNAFTGPVPEIPTRPRWLSLADNRLEGLPITVLNASAHPLGARFLDLSGNRFSGNVPASVMEVAYLPHDGASRWGGGLNLCWNDFEVNNAVVREWLESVHVGGEFASCLARERAAIDPTISGSWFDPARSGEGIAIQQLENGSNLIYFFTFDEQGRQQWLFDVQENGVSSIDWNGLLRTRGRFGEGLFEDEEPAVEVRGSFRVDRLGDDRLMAERVYIDQTDVACLAIYPPPLSCYGTSLSDRREYQRLSELAGTTCENQSRFQQYSGAWYNPDRSGEGLIVEVLPDNRAIVYWFTYRPESDSLESQGDQAWLVAADEIQALFTGTPPASPYGVAMIEAESVVQPTGGVWGESFSSEAITNQDVLGLTLTFNNDGSAHLAWESHADGDYGTGDYPLTRLTRPKLADCD